MKQYVVDAFTDKLFGGNPAAVCVMDHWLSDELMLKIARENNLSETSFTVKEKNGYRLRWFTPGNEIDLCGHATLATAYVLTRFVEPELELIQFYTLSGTLIVKKINNFFELDLPSYDIQPVELTNLMSEVIGVLPKEAYLGRDLLCILDSEEAVRAVTIDEEKAKKLDGLLLHVTAKGRDFDCVSRSFAPKLNVSEDPVCGSGHCHIVPYWAKYFGKERIVAFQASQRGGVLICKLDIGRVKLSGTAVLYSIAELYV